MNTKDIAKEVYRYAMTHYNKDGWDYVVECMDAEEIAEELKEEGITSFDKAIKFYDEIYGIVNEKRQEAKSYAW